MPIKWYVVKSRAVSAGNLFWNWQYKKRNHRKTKSNRKSFSKSKYLLKLWRNALFLKLKLEVRCSCHKRTLIFLNLSQIKRKRTNKPYLLGIRFHIFLKYTSVRSCFLYSVYNFVLSFHPYRSPHMSYKPSIQKETNNNISNNSCNKNSNIMSSTMNMTFRWPCIVINSVRLFVCPSGRLSVRTEQLGFYWMDFYENLYLRIFRHLSTKFKAH